MAFELYSPNRKIFQYGRSFLNWRESILSGNKWKALLHICHSFYFTYRNIIAERHEPEETINVILKFWEEIGRGTAEAYLKRGTVNIHNFTAIAESIKRSCNIMGEVVELIKKNENDVIVRHTYCPWWKWHKSLGLEKECELICDKWFESVVKNLNSKISIMTLKSFASGDSCCERRIWL